MINPDEDHYNATVYLFFEPRLGDDHLLFSRRSVTMRNGRRRMRDTYSREGFHDNDRCIWWFGENRPARG